MTYQQPDFTLPAELLAQIAEQGFDALPELIRMYVQGVSTRKVTASNRDHPRRRMDQPCCRNGFAE